MPQDKWHLFWDEFAQKSYDVVGKLPENKIMLSRIATLVGKNNHVLDAGCGTGNLSLLLAPHNTIVGIDAAPSMLAVAEQKLKEYTIPLSIGDVTALDFESSSFDAITSVNVLFNLEKPELLLQEAHRVLKPGGKLFLSTPLAGVSISADVKTKILDDAKKHNVPIDLVTDLLERNRALFADGGMRFLPTKEQLIDLATNTGFKIDHFEMIYYGGNGLMVCQKPTE